MSKILIIKGADFTQNAFDSIAPSIVPTTRKDGFWNYETGAYEVESPIRTCNTYYLSVVPGKTYIITCDKNSIADFVFYNTQKAFVSNNLIKDKRTNFTITIPSNCSYLCFNIYDNFYNTTPSTTEVLSVAGTTVDALISEDRT